MAGFQTPITIKQAIDRIREKAYLLPAFQREYVWSSIQVENLFDSLMKDYPISSMLFWKVKGEAKNSYKFYQVLDRYVQRHHIHNDPFNTNQVNDFHAVLDGQQRLTSLYIGLCGTYAYHKFKARWDNVENNFPTRVLYLNITSLIEDENSDKTYNFSFKEVSVTKNQDLYTDKNGDRWFRVGRILTLPGMGFPGYNIGDFAEENNLTRNEQGIIHLLRWAIFEKNSINFYEIEDTNPDTAVNIFVRINSGGTTLSFSNILMSMAIAGWTKKDARKEINDLVDSINNRGFNITQDYVLKAFLYLYKSDVKFKIKTFNNDFISHIEENWDSIRDCIDELFELLRGYGFDRSTLTSYNATLPILYYIYHRNIYRDFSRLTAFNEDRKVIQKWLLKTLIYRTFGASSDRVLQLSRKAFTDNLADGFMTKNVVVFPADELSTAIRQPKELTDDYIDSHILSIHKDNSYAFAILALLYSNLDYRNTFHKDHIHPYVLCQEKGYDLNLYDTILNLQMLDANENMSKNDKSLEVWVNEQTNEDSRSQFLKSHLIPDIDLSLDNFDEYIEKRREILHERIKQIFRIEAETSIVVTDDDDIEDEEDF